MKLMALRRLPLTVGGTLDLRGRRNHRVRPPGGGCPFLPVRVQPPQPTSRSLPGMV